jgi:hypothetical protein
MGLGRVSIPSNPSFQQTAKVLNDLVPQMKPAAKWLKEGRDLANEFSQFKKDYTKATHEIKAFQRKAKPAVDFFSKQRKNLEGFVKKFPAMEKAIKGIEKLTKPITRALGSAAASKIVGSANFAFGIAGVGLGLGNLWLSGELSKSTQNQIDLFGREAARTLKTSINQGNRIKQLEKREKINSADLDRLSKATGEIRIFVNKQLTNFQTRLDAIKKQANDALYEVRAGRKILEPKIASAAKNANDALYEVRVGRKILESKIAVAEKKGNDALYEVRAGRNILDGKIAVADKKANDALYRIPPIEAKINNLIKNGVGSADKLPANILEKINRAAIDASKALSSTTQIPSIINKEIQTNVIPTLTRNINNKLEEIRKENNLKLDRKLDKDRLTPGIQENASLIIRIVEPYFKSQLKPYIDATGTLQNTVGNLTTNIRDNIKINDKQNIDIDFGKAEIGILKERIRKQEKVNEDGNRKLEDLLKLTLLVPPLIAKVPDQTAARIKPFIPTIDQIARNTPTPVCRFTEDGIKRHVTSDGSNSRVRMEAYHLAELVIAKDTNNLAKLADKKLGGQLAGGLSAGISRIFQNAIVDRAIAYLTYVTALHNAFQLSNSLTQTLFSAADTILQALGIKLVGVNGEELNAGQVVNSFFFSFFASIFGQDNANGMRKSWLQYSRIYQAASNMYSGIQSMFDSARSIGEMTVANVGKIGNALKKAGTVYENAYNWMSEKATAASARQQVFEKFRQGIEQAENITSSIENVASNVVSIQSELTEFKNNKNQFDAAITGETEQKTNEEAAQKPNLTITFDNANLGRSDADV